MREQAKIQLHGESEAFETAWNSTYEPKIEYGLVALYKDESSYERLRQLFDSFVLKYPVTWYEHTSVEYSEAELASFELLRLHVIGQAGAGDNSFVQVYVAESVCTACSRVKHSQVRNLVLNYATQEDDPEEIGYFQHDMCKTDADEVVVSERVKSVLATHGVLGIELRPIENSSTINPIGKSYFQLIAQSQIGPLVEPTLLEQRDYCTSCRQYREVLYALPGSMESEFYFRRDSYKGAWIMSTTDVFGRSPHYASELIINQQFYHLLKRNNITGFWVQPVHLI